MVVVTLLYVGATELTKRWFFARTTGTPRSTPRARRPPSWPPSSRPSEHSALRSVPRRGSTIVVDNPIHPLHGQAVVVRAVLRAGGTRAYQVDHPCGGTFVVPESCVGPGLARSGAPPFDPARLSSLADRVEALQKQLDMSDTAGHDTLSIDVSCANSVQASPTPRSGRRSARPSSRSTRACGGRGERQEPGSGGLR